MTKLKIASLLGLVLALGLASALRAEPIFVPEKDMAKMSLPYRVAFVNRYEKCPEIPPLFVGLVEKEIRAFLKMGLGPLAALDQDEGLSRQILGVLDARGIERVTAADFPQTCPFDRIILGDVRKNANLFEIRLKEVAPQDVQISPIIRIRTMHPQKIGRLYATAATENFSLEGYITDLEPAAEAAGARPSPDIKVVLRARDLLPQEFSAPTTRVIFRITEVFTDFGGKVLERRLLPWWYVEMEAGKFRLVGQDFKTHPDTEEYRVSYKLHRIQLQGGKQTVRLVSQKDPDRRLPNYSVYASYTPVIDRYRNLVGLTNDNGEVEVVDKERLPIYLRVEKQGFLMRELMMLVQPEAGPFEIPLPEYNPKLPELVQRAEDLGNRMVELHNKLNGAQTKAAELVADPVAREAQFEEAERARAALVGVAKDIKDLERDAAGAGADLDAYLTDVKKEYARRTENLPDLQALRAKLNEAASTISGATKSLQIEQEAARLWAELKWEEAQAKYEEALRNAPDDQKRRIEQKLAVVKPMDQSHAAARRFVRDELPLLDERAACDRVAEIETHVKRLMDAQDTPFIDAALKKLGDLSNRLLAAVGKLMKEAKNAPGSAAEKGALAQKMLDASKRLDALIQKLSGPAGKGASGSVPSAPVPKAEGPAQPDVDGVRRFVSEELPSLDERAACERITEIEGEVQQILNARDPELVAQAAKKLDNLSWRLVTSAGRLLHEAEQDPKSGAEKATTAQRMLDTSKRLESVIAQLGGGKAAAPETGSGADSSAAAPPGPVMDTATLYEKNVEAVVLILGKSGPDTMTQGTGFIVDPSGVIVTCSHVVQGKCDLAVKTKSGAIYSVKQIMGNDPDHDVAVLKVEASGLPTVKLGTYKRLKVGSKVFVIGNPQGLEASLTDGIVSSIRCALDESRAYIQITAPISPGSSGGPVFTDRGEVVGLVSFLLKGGQNLNFATPIDFAKRLIPVP